MRHAKLQAATAAFLKAGDYQATDSGILVHNAIMLSGRYFHSVNNQDERIDHNLIPAAGILHILDTVLRNQAVNPAWYVAPYAGAVTPAANLTAANFAATVSEITSGTEGYSETTRPQWVPSVATAGAIDNLAAKANFTILCSTTLNINGAGLLSAAAKGATSGVLVSASRFSATRQVNNGDTWQCGYQIALTDS